MLDEAVLFKSCVLKSERQPFFFKCMELPFKLNHWSLISCQKSVISVDLYKKYNEKHMLV